MANYLEQVKLAMAVDQQRKGAATDAELEQWEQRLTPLVERLSKLLAQIPPALRAEGLSLTELRKMLRGRRRGNVHPGELGAALRTLKYVRVRRWRGGQQGFNAVWRQHHGD